MSPSRHIELDIDIGADARDWSAIQAQEKLKPVETDLRRIEELVNEIVNEMDYLRTREQKLRDTNESTNERVKWFAFGTMGMLVGLGAWQVVYLRAYFRYVESQSWTERGTDTCAAARSISSRGLRLVNWMCTLINLPMFEQEKFLDYTITCLCNSLLISFSAVDRTSSKILATDKDPS